ncbi:MAG: hypothetical protein IKK79_01335 [Spirochaetaceae bacterium]|nr:hypothetical protein [Spirochaetaceae bacterium]
MRFNSFSEYIATFFLFCTCLIFMTPLNSSSGYLILLVLVISLYSAIKKGKIKNKKISKYYLTIFVIFFCWVLYLILMYSELKKNKVYMNNSILMLCTGIFASLYGLILSQNVSECKNNINNKTILIDYLYYILYVYILSNLLFYGYHNISDWQNRMYLENNTFTFGYHHVDFSVISFFVIAIGVKRCHYVSALLLIILSWQILPSRTFKLFILLYILFVLIMYTKELKKGVFKLLSKSISVNILLLFILTMLFALVFIVVLPSFFEVQSSHHGLYDTSNTDRFNGFLYALEVIYHEKLYLSGILPNESYEMIISDSKFKTSVYPHNSYLSIFLYYSIFFGLTYLIGIFLLLQKYFTNKKNIPFIFSYLITACILHDMLISVRIFVFLTILLIPEKKTNFLHNFTLIIRGCSG